ncbi:hypothetical protein J2X36_004402 [Methylobacterium sp. BE186]|nr:hypothetical protein [Methylobacterium sp. BE186]
MDRADCPFQDGPAHHQCCRGPRPQMVSACRMDRACLTGSCFLRILFCRKSRSHQLPCSPRPVACGVAPAPFVRLALQFCEGGELRPTRGCRASTPDMAPSAQVTPASHRRGQLCGGTNLRLAAHGSRGFLLPRFNCANFQAASQCQSSWAERLSQRGFAGANLPRFVGRAAASPRTRLAPQAPLARGAFRFGTSWHPQVWAIGRAPHPSLPVILRSLRGRAELCLGDAPRAGRRSTGSLGP